jgi:type II secretory pathway pseudopilin PulG
MAPRATKGLTFIELMLVMTLLSALLMTVTGLVQQGLRVAQQLDATTTLTQTHELALEQITRDLEDARRCYRAPFVGAADQVTLARVDPTSQQWVRLIYRLEDHRLVRDATMLTPDGEQPLERRVLLPMVESAQFEFGWRDPTTHAIMWQSLWPDTTDHPIPQFTRVHLTLPGSNHSTMQLARIARNLAGLVPEEHP